MHNLERSKICFSEILWNLNSLYSLSYSIIPSICQTRAKILICPSDRFRSEPFFKMIVFKIIFRCDSLSKWPVFEATQFRSDLFSKLRILRKDPFFEKTNFSKRSIFRSDPFSKWSISKLLIFRSELFLRWSI